MSIGYGDQDNYIDVSFKSLGYFCGDGLKELETTMGNNGQYYFEFTEDTYPGTSEKRITYAYMHNRATHDTVLHTSFLSDYSLNLTGSLVNMKKISHIPENIELTLELDGTMHYGLWGNLREI